MMTGWEQDVVTKRWRPAAPRPEPVGGRRPCRAPVRAIVGVLVEPGLTEDRSGFLPLADVDRILMAVLDPGTLAGRGIGALRHRHSPGVQGGYVSNGCPECDALVGRFRVDDLLAEHLAMGGALADVAVDITVDLLGEQVWRGAVRLV